MNEKYLSKSADLGFAEGRRERKYYKWTLHHMKKECRERTRIHPQ